MAQARPRCSKYLPASWTTTAARCRSRRAAAWGLISQIPVYPEGYTVEDVLRTAFARMFRMKDEMDALTLAMEQGASDDATLRRYGELNARFEGLGGWDTDTAVNKVANGLSISDEMRTRLFDRLSGGEKTRVNLGRLILEDTDVLLLDEPTNHLDLQATEWLEDYLRNFRGTVVTISHDRYFLDRTVTRIIEIQDGKAEFYSGNYSFYAIEKERRYQERMKQYLKEQAKIQQLERRRSRCTSGLLWATMRCTNGPSPWKAHRAYAHHPKAHQGPPTGGPLPEPGVQGRRGPADQGHLQVLWGA